MEIVKLRIKGTLVNISMAKLDRTTKTKKINKYRNILERIIKN